MSGRGRKVVRKETGSTGASRNIAPRLCSRSCNACASFLSQGLQRRSRRGIAQEVETKEFCTRFRGSNRILCGTRKTVARRNSRNSMAEKSGKTAWFGDAHRKVGSIWRT